MEKWAEWNGTIRCCPFSLSFHFLCHNHHIHTVVDFFASPTLLSRVCDGAKMCTSAPLMLSTPPPMRKVRNSPASGLPSHRLYFAILFFCSELHQKACPGLRELILNFLGAADWLSFSRPCYWRHCASLYMPFSEPLYAYVRSCCR